MPPQAPGCAGLHGVLDVLRIMVGAADDDDVLDAAGDEQLAGLVEEAEIAGAQPAFASPPRRRSRAPNVASLASGLRQ